MHAGESCAWLLKWLKWDAGLVYCETWLVTQRSRWMAKWFLMLIFHIPNVVRRQFAQHSMSTKTTLVTQTRGGNTRTWRTLRRGAARGWKRRPRLSRVWNVVSQMAHTLLFNSHRLTCNGFQNYLRLPAEASRKVAYPTWTSCLRPNPSCELHPYVYIFFSYLGTDPRRQTGQRLW